MEQESAKEKMGKWSIEGFLAPPSFYRRQLHWALKLKQAWIGARQVLMAITPCTTGLRTALKITHGLARAVETHKTSRPSSNSFGYQSHCCWGQSRDWKDGAFGTTRGTWSQWGRRLSVSQRRPADVYLPNWGPMDLPPWTLQPSMVCGAQCLPPLLETRLRQLQSTRSEKSSTYCPAVCWTRHSSSRWWLTCGAMQHHPGNIHQSFAAPRYSAAPCCV